MRLLLIGLLVALALVPNFATAQEDEIFETWAWHELGLAFEYPAGWQPSLSTEGYAFILFGEPTADGGVSSYITLQTGTYAPEEDTLGDLFQEIAGEGVEVTESEFAGVPAWEFEYLTEGRLTRFIGFGANENDLALLGLSALENDWENAPFDTVLESASLTPIELDTAELNAQMQTLYAEEGILGVGDPDAPVTMVEFMDFSCPHCVNYEDSVQRIVQDYVVDGEVFLQFAVLDIIGGEASQVAAQAQVCGTELGFGWDMHELLYELFHAGGSENYTAETITAAVEDSTLDVDAGAFQACMTESDISEFIGTNLTLAEEMTVSSTPTLMFSEGDGELDFIRNSAGEAYRGGLPLILIYQQLDDLLAEE